TAPFDHWHAALSRAPSVLTAGGAPGTLARRPILRGGSPMPPVHVRALPLAAIILIGSWAGAPARPADNPFAPDTPEPGSVDQIRKATTDAKYLPAAVSYVPDSRTVPSPSKFLGHIAGAPGELSDTATVIRYFRALDAASDRVTVTTIGKSEEG